MRFLRTVLAVIKLFVYLCSYNKRLRYAKKLDKEGKIAERDVFVAEQTHRWGRYIVGLTKSDVVVRGQEKLPAGPAVFIGNHQGNFDIPVLLGYINKPIAFMSKIEIKKVPMLSDWMVLMQCTFLDRKNPRQSLAAMLEAIESVKNGYSLVIFPEGHRSKGGPVGEFKAGSFKLAYKAGAPIIPVTMDGSWRLYEEKGGLNKGSVTVTIHDPVPTAGLTKEEQAALPEKVRATIISALGTTAG